MTKKNTLNSAQLFYAWRRPSKFWAEKEIIVYAEKNCVSRQDAFNALFLWRYEVQPVLHDSHVLLAFDYQRSRLQLLAVRARKRKNAKWLGIDMAHGRDESLETTFTPELAPNRVVISSRVL